MSLVQFLIQLGPEITADADVVRAILERFDIAEANPPRDSQVIDIIGTLGRLAAEGAALCDIGALVRALSSFVRYSSTIASLPIHVSQARPT